MVGWKSCCHREGGGIEGNEEEYKKRARERSSDPADLPTSTHLIDNFYNQTFRRTLPMTGVLATSLFFNSSHIYFCGTRWTPSRKDCLKMCAFIPIFKWLIASRPSQWQQDFHPASVDVRNSCLKIGLVNMFLSFIWHWRGRRETNGTKEPGWNGTVDIAAMFKLS